MKFSTVCLLLCASALLVFASEDEVVVLTDANFDEYLSKNPLMLVEFYAPWCGHCKKLEPEYSKAAADLKGKEVVIAKVDATVETKLGERFKIEGFPTLKLFREGTPSEYNGGRSAADIVSYIEKQLGPAVTYITSAADLANAIPKEKQNPIVVGYFAKGSSEETTFSNFAKKFRDDFKFYGVQDKNIATGQKADLGKIVLYKPFDDLSNVYDGKVDDESALKSFLSQNSIKLVDEISPQNYKQYVDRGIPIAWLFVDPKSDKTAAAIAELEKVAGDYRELSFVHLSGVQYGQMVTKMALSGTVFPSLAIETTDGSHYVFDETTPITADNLRPWLKSYKEGTLQPKIRSEPIPESSHDENNVRVLVGDNFKEVVMDTTKDVLVEFYAPYCGHCKRLEPIYADLAKKVKEVGADNIVIAKMDSTNNDATGGFQISGYPTIVLVKGETNELIPYNGARTLDDMLKFIQTNGKYGNQLPKANDEL